MNEDPKAFSLRRLITDYRRIIAGILANYGKSNIRVSLDYWQTTSALLPDYTQTIAWLLTAYQQNVFNPSPYSLMHCRNTAIPSIEYNQTIEDYRQAIAELSSDNRRAIDIHMLTIVWLSPVFRQTPSRQLLYRQNTIGRLGQTPPEIMTRLSEDYRQTITRLLTVYILAIVRLSIGYCRTTLWQLPYIQTIARFGQDYS